MLHYIQCSAMHKICGKAICSVSPLNETAALTKEHIFFQIAVWSDSSRPKLVKIKDLSNTFNEIFLVKSVPVSFDHYPDDQDQNYIATGPTMIPDCLIPLSSMDTISVGSDPTLLWVTARAHFAGEYTISYQFSSEGESITTSFAMKVLDRALLSGRCSLTASFSPQSIAANENIPLFSNVFWEQLSNHFRLAKSNGIKDIITPLFASAESDCFDRIPDQLIKIRVNKKKYEYNFDTMDSWLLEGIKNGIENFTFSALFPSMISQKCPRVYAEGYKKQYLIFSEEDHILSDKYIQFLRDFLRKFNSHLKEIGLLNRVTYIMTEEITPDYASIYNECFKSIQKALSGQKIISKMRPQVTNEFEGFPAPIVPIDAVEPYLIYPFAPKINFDINKSDGFMNQLIAAPAMRIRSFGLLCYLHDFGGIVLDHYNCSISPITNKAFDPLISPDGDGAFPAGSLFMVYNHAHGPYPSMRLHLLRAAIQDSVLLYLLEDYLPRERIIAMIEREFSFSINHYPTDIDQYHRFMDKIHALYETHLKKQKKK